MENDPHSGLIILILAFLLLTGPVCGAGVVSGYFKPSVSSGYAYRWYYREWLDYCPACGHYGVLTVNPKGTVEGELTCVCCDADYCGVTGWDKGGKRWKLIRSSVKTVKNSKIDFLKIIVHGIDGTAGSGLTSKGEILSVDL